MILLALAVLFSQAAMSQEHAIYKSVDRGVTWAKVGANFVGNPRINSFGTTRDKIFAGTDAGIYSSSRLLNLDQQEIQIAWNHASRSKHNGILPSRVASVLRDSPFRGFRNCLRIHTAARVAARVRHPNS